MEKSRLGQLFFTFLLVTSLMLQFIPNAYSSTTPLIDDSLEGQTSSTTSNLSYYTGYKGGKGVFLQNSETLTYNIDGLDSEKGTVEFWIKPDWKGTDDEELVLFDCDGFIKITKKSDGNLNYEYNSASFLSEKSAGWVKDEWHNIALTWEIQADDTVVFIGYVDGIVVGKVDEVDPAENLGTEMTFGTSLSGTTFDEIMVSDTAKRFDELKVNTDTLGSTVCYFAEGAVGNALMKDYTLDTEYPGFYPENVSLENASRELYIFNPNYENAEIKLKFYDTEGVIRSDEFGEESTYRGEIIEIPPMGSYMINISNIPPLNHDCLPGHPEYLNCLVPEFSYYLGKMYKYVQLQGDREYSTIIESTNGVGITAFSSKTAVDYDIDTSMENVYPRDETQGRYLDGGNAVNKPSSTWYFPWASTLIKQYDYKAGKEFNVFCETYLNVFNPQEEDAEIKLELFFEEDVPITITSALIVPAGTRRTMKLSSLEDFPKNKEFSFKVTAINPEVASKEVPVVVSKTVYYNSNGRPFWSGVGLRGMPAPATGLYTGDFNTWFSADSDIFIMNPHEDSARVQIALAAVSPKPDMYLQSNPDYSGEYDPDNSSTWQFIAVTDKNAVVTLQPRTSIRIPLRAIAMQKEGGPPEECPYGIEDEENCGCSYSGNCPLFDATRHSICAISALPNDNGKTPGVIYEHSLSWWSQMMMDWWRNGNYIGFEDTFDDYLGLPEAFQDDLTPVRLAPNGRRQEKRVTRNSTDGEINRVTGEDAVYGAAVDLTYSEPGQGKRIWYPMSADSSADVTGIDEVNNTRCVDEKFSQAIFKEGSFGETKQHLYLGFWVKPNWNGDDDSPRVLLHMGEHLDSLLDGASDNGTNQIVVYKGEDKLLHCLTINNSGDHVDAVFDGNNAVQWESGRWYFMSFVYTYNGDDENETGNMKSTVTYFDGESLNNCTAAASFAGEPPVQFESIGQQISLGAEIPDASGELIYPANAVFDEFKIGEKFPALYNASETIGYDDHFLPQDYLSKNGYAFSQLGITALPELPADYLMGFLNEQLNLSYENSMSLRSTFFDPFGEQLLVNCTSPNVHDNDKKCGEDYRKDSYEVIDIGPMDSGSYQYDLCINNDNCEIEGTSQDGIPLRMVVYADAPYDEPPVSTVKLQSIKNSDGRQMPFATGGPMWRAYGFFLTMGISPGIERTAFYVDEAIGNDTNTGRTWQAPLATIKAAIDAADLDGNVHGDNEINGVAEDGAIIFVAGGTYQENITLAKNVILMGGYPSGGGARDVIANETTIDGGADDHVVVGSDYAVIDGFTIQNGFGCNGAGIKCDGTSPTIRNCILTENHADSTCGWGAHGGGIYINDASPVITNNRIAANTSVWGGGILVRGNSSPVIEKNNITANTAYLGGGILEKGNAAVLFANNIIAHNTASSGFGGGIYISDNNTTVVNNTIVSNNNNGGIMIDNAVSHPVITNNILWDNGDDLMTSSTLDCSKFNHNNIEDGDCEGQNGNISEAPIFVDSAGDDYHLSSPSPCIDSGTSFVAPVADIDDTPRPLGNGYDIGAYEYSVDSDNDGVLDNVDNCPLIPNGPILGSCFGYYDLYMGYSCRTHDDCRTGDEWYRWCDTVQYDADNDTYGDVCDPTSYP